MQNIDITNGKPFKDKTLTNRIIRLENEVPSIYTIPYATFSNPSTTERTFIETSGLGSKQPLFATVNAVSNITSTISGIQDFTYKLYLGGTVVSTAVVTVPDALNTLFSVKLEAFVTYTRTNSGELEYVGNLVATPLSTSATASVSTITVVNTQSPIVNRTTIAGDFDVKLSCTASVGTATTVVTCMGGRVTFDNKN